ncbi:MAG: endonuclease/exonuclease/phosphatase family protein [Williamsia sp.]|nr:endonuclease/exonuclease/phosphatase family protein [Williamsia sp.]
MRSKNTGREEQSAPPGQSDTTSLGPTNDVVICSWNLKDFGKSKSDQTIEFIANAIRNVDVLAIQEVVAGSGGPQAVGRLVDVLNRKGAKWDYTISDPTSSKESGTERYAFIWKPSRVKKIGNAWLEKKYSEQIDREPYMATFQVKNKFFTMASFHAIPKAKQPETEIRYLRYVPDEYPGKNLIFGGDFNCPESHSVFNALKNMDYQPVFVKQKTSLRSKCVNNDCLASEYDNLFCKRANIRVINSGVMHFYKSFSNIKDAIKVSDHIPVYMKFSVN